MGVSVKTLSPSDARNSYASPLNSVLHLASVWWVVLQLPTMGETNPKLPLVALFDQMMLDQKTLEEGVEDKFLAYVKTSEVNKKKKETPPKKKKKKKKKK